MERCCSPPLAQGHLQPETAIGLQPEGALPCQSAARFAQAAGPEAGTGGVEPAGLIMADVVLLQNLRADAMAAEAELSGEKEGTATMECTTVFTV